MTVIFKIITGIIFLLIGIYLAFNIYLNEYRLPVLKLENLLGKKRKYRILAVDPHPDDETMLSGGFLAKFANDESISLKHICVTCGERGDELLKVKPAKLARIREEEYKMATKELKLQQCEIWKFSDGALEEEYDELEKKLLFEVEKFNPDIILVYEKDGLYGHPDHIVVSEIMHNIANTKTKDTVVLYKTLPKSVLKNIRLPVHMANGKNLHQAEPKYRLPLGKEILLKYKAAKKHKSQNLTHGKPMWLLMLLMNNEYFTDEF